MDRRIVAAVVLAAIALIGAACSSGEPKKAASSPLNTVTIQGFLFKPASLAVQVGTEVTWTNQDDIAHTITSGTPGHPTGAFDSGDESLAKTFTHSFGTAGTFAYFCKNHNSMTGQITVT